MRYEIVSEQIKKAEKSGTADILKINAVYPRIVEPSGDEVSSSEIKFAASFNDMYEKAAQNFIKFAETSIKKTAESQYAVFDADNGERFTPFGAVFTAKVALQDDDIIRVHIETSAYPGKSKRTVHVLDKKNMKFLKPKSYL